MARHSSTCPENQDPNFTTKRAGYNIWRLAERKAIMANYQFKPGMPGRITRLRLFGLNDIITGKVVH
jgi:hypothetical protein